MLRHAVTPRCHTSLSHLAFTPRHTLRYTQARDAVAAQSLQEKDATDDAPSGQQGAKRVNGPHPLLRCFTQCYPAVPDLRATHSIVLK